MESEMSTIPDAYLSGEQLIGDDYDTDALNRWYADEAEAYADLGSKDRQSYVYEYHALNRYHAYRHLPADTTFGHALGYGSAWGDEIRPIASSVSRLTVVEPSEAFDQTEVAGIPTQYVRAEKSGTLPFADSTFDLITCFGVLHHVPNVSYVLREFHRVLTPHGFALVREPIVSMGDWTQPRRGLTPRERGIPLDLFRRMVAEAGFDIGHEGLCDFALTGRIGNAINRHPYNSDAAVRLDAALCQALRWNATYHATTTRQKLRPASVSLVLKPI